MYTYVIQYKYNSIHLNWFGMCLKKHQVWWLWRIFLNAASDKNCNLISCEMVSGQVWIYVDRYNELRFAKHLHYGFKYIYINVSLNQLPTTLW